MSRDQNCTLNSIKSTSTHFFHLKYDTISNIKNCLNRRFKRRRDSIFIIVDEINMVNNLKNSNFYLDDDIYIIHNFSIYELYKVTLQSPIRSPFLGTFDANHTLEIHSRRKWKRRNNLEVKDILCIIINIFYLRIKSSK